MGILCRDSGASIGLQLMWGALDHPLVHFGVSAGIPLIKSDKTLGNLTARQNFFYILSRTFFFFDSKYLAPFPSLSFYHTSQCKLLVRVTEIVPN